MIRNAARTSRRGIESDTGPRYFALNSRLFLSCLKEYPTPANTVSSPIFANQRSLYRTNSVSSQRRDALLLHMQNFRATTAPIAHRDTRSERLYSTSSNHSYDRRCTFIQYLSVRVLSTKSSSNDQEGSADEGAHAKSKMDSDFSKYLTEDPAPNTETKTKRLDDASLQIVLSRTGRVTPTRGPRRITQDDMSKDQYERIVHLQGVEIEKSRLKTRDNVNRALLGNVGICMAKFAAWLSSGSSAMLAEFIHSMVDCGNQSLLLIGLRDSQLNADRKHPYGYGKSVYFWALVSALGTFFLGAGVSMTFAVGDLMDPKLHAITPEVWGVLIFSFAVDGYVLGKTITETMESKPEGISYFQHIQKLRDPATLAILLEDGAACIGVVLALGGIAASHVTGNPVFDGIAGVGISGLLGLMGILLARTNHRFLLGQAVDKEITDDIGKILNSRRSIDSIRSIQSQWTGPETFSYKAEVDFDGTYLAARLMPIYQSEFVKIRDTMDEELRVMLALYAEDVMRTVEREVRYVEAKIRKRYPGAEYIELEPMSMDADRYALDDNLMSELKRAESDILNNYLRSMKKDGTYDTIADGPPKDTDQAPRNS